jgi:tetratricopeptide (TPR) repeat protein
MGFAEDAYLFRHTMMRLAAYELQPPLERSELHAHAFAIIEALPHDDPDIFAYELAGHARDAALALPDERRRNDLHQREAGWLNRAMLRARTNNNYRIVLECAERLLANEAAELSTRHAAALLGAEMCASLGEFPRVPEFLDQAETLQTDEEPMLRATWILSCVNALHLPQREYDKAVESIEEALKISRESDDRLAEARALGYLGNVMARLDKRRQAAELYEQAETIFRELGHMRGVSTSRGNLGLMYRYFGDNERAEAAYREALRIDREIGNREGIPRHLGNLGVLYRESARLREALELCEESADLFRELGDRTGWMRNAINQATCFEMMGQFHRAVTLYQSAERVAHECGLELDAADCMYYRGAALLKLDDTVRGEPALETSALCYEQLDAPKQAGEVWEELAESAAAREEDEAALRYATAALQNLKVATIEPCFSLLARHAEAALSADRFAEAATSASRALKAAEDDDNVDPIRLAMLKAIAKKGQASPAT